MKITHASARFVLTSTALIVGFSTLTVSAIDLSQYSERGQQIIMGKFPWQADRDFLKNSDCVETMGSGSDQSFGYSLICHFDEALMLEHLKKFPSQDYIDYINSKLTYASDVDGLITRITSAEIHHPEMLKARISSIIIGTRFENTADLEKYLSIMEENNYLVTETYIRDVSPFLQDVPVYNSDEIIARLRRIMSDRLASGGTSTGASVTSTTTASTGASEATGGAVAASSTGTYSSGTGGSTTTQEGRGGAITTASGRSAQSVTTTVTISVLPTASSDIVGSLSEKDQALLQKAFLKLDVILSAKSKKVGASMLDKVIYSVDVSLSKNKALPQRIQFLYGALRSHCLSLITSDPEYSFYSRYAE